MTILVILAIYLAAMILLPTTPVTEAQKAVLKKVERCPCCIAWGVEKRRGMCKNHWRRYWAAAAKPETEKQPPEEPQTPSNPRIFPLHHDFDPHIHPQGTGAPPKWLRRQI